MPEKIFKCIVSYDGSDFSGWQKQKNAVTIQGTIEYALYKYFGFPVKIYGAGRTDAGVHAFGQVFNFSAETRLNGSNLLAIMNDMLPPDIKVIDVSEAGTKFSARHGVRKKFYRYVIYNSPVFYPFYSGKCWHVAEKINTKKLKESFSYFRGEKDYFSFSSSGSDPGSYTREIEKIKMSKIGRFIAIDFFGKGFLYNMIRKTVHIMACYALDRITGKEIEGIFARRDRSLIKSMAPAAGLYLVKIIYEKKPGERS